ncbi:MAG: translocation/assembly module TamB [Bacteroidales bacterium]|nr:translocation/assembly module TamB [Bacteroidales bacterium]
MLTVFVMLLLPSLAYLTLRSSAVQTWLTSRAASYLSDELGAEVSVGGVKISWFFNVVLEDISLLDKHGNPLLYAREMVFDVNKISFSRRNFQVNKLLLDRASLGMTRYPGEDDYNFQFLLDYFGSDVPADTFSLPKWDVIVRSFEFRNSGLSFIDRNAEHQEYGFDPGNFAFGKLNLAITDISFENDVLHASLDHFSVEESKGLVIEDIKARLMISPKGSYANDMTVVTHRSRVEMDVSLDYESFRDFNVFAENVRMGFDIKPSTLQLYELGYFITSLYGLDNRIQLKGNLSGTLSNFRGNEVLLQYGMFSTFQGNFLVLGLPDIQETFLNFSLNRFVTNKRELETFKIPYSTGVAPLKLPSELQNLGVANFSGNLTGFIYDFVAFGRLKTALGEVTSDIAIRSNDDFTSLSYSGSLATRGLDLGTLLDDTDNFGQIAFDMKVAGSGTDLESLDLTMEGLVQKLDFKNYNYRNLELAGALVKKRFTGNLLMDDPNLFVDFNGLLDFSGSIPYLNFTAQIDDANLSALNIYQRDTLYQSVLSTILSVEGHVESFNDIEGEMAAFSTTYREIIPENGYIQNQYHTETISLRIYRGSQNQKFLRFTSDFLDVKVDGMIDYESLVSEFSEFVSHYIPSRFQNNIFSHASNDTISQKGEFEIYFKKTADLTAIFLPGLKLSDNVLIRGNFDTRNRIFLLEGAAEYFAYAGNGFKDLKIKANSDSTAMDFVSSASRFSLSDSIWMDQFHLIAKVIDDTFTIRSEWENQNTEVKNNGHIEAVAKVLSPSETEIRIQSSYAYINDSLWSIRPTNRILIDSAYIHIEDFFLYNNDEFLKVDGRLSDNPDDELHIVLNNFNVESLMHFLRGRKIDFGGVSSGEIVLSNIQKTPNISANLLIKDFSFNHDHLGDLSLNSKWDAAEKAFKIDAEIIYYGNVGFNKPLIARGYFYPEREPDNFDLDILIENLQMSMFSRYLEGVTSNFRGLASGRLRLDGPLSSPELSGRARLVRTGFRVDYTNTSYSFAHELEIGKDFFRFENLTLNDTLGNSANVSGIIRHTRFMDFSVDISFLLDRIAVLNTRPHHNDLFYGRAFASGFFRVHGPVNDIVMDISAQANRGTQFFLPLDYSGEFTESSFINFVSPDKISNGEIPMQRTQISGISLNFDLEVTPEAEIQIIFDSQIGDIMRSRGFGDLKFEIDNQGAFNMYGDYTIQDGDYLFTLQNLINKRFRMEQGGTIRWSGDIDADLDVRAVYRLRTSLFDLAANQSDTTEAYRRRVPVETVLHLQDKLFNPSVSFDIQLPGGDESTREMIERIITTEQEMNRQVFSLLILNRFVPPEDGFNTALGYGMGSTSLELLSNQLSNWLSQISSDFDIGINYRPGDEISSQEIEVAWSTQLFDDRVVIDGNVGVAGNHPANNQRASNIIGDVNVEVKITPEGKFRIKAFNRSNTFDVMNSNAPYTQGVGVFYRREFDHLGEIFRKRSRTVPELPDFEETELPEKEALRSDSDGSDSQ